MQNLLFFTTYPINSAFHGGQIRSRNLVKAYETAGFNVITVAYYNPFHYKKGETGKYDIKVPQKILPEMQLCFTDDYESGQFSIKDKNFINHLANLNNKYPFSFIHIENPWLFPIANYLKKQNPNIKIVFGSENIEYRLKNSIYQQYNLTDPRYKKKLEEIRLFEISVANNCDLMICVTEQDKTWFVENCNNKLKILLIPNAVEEFDYNENNKLVKNLQEELGIKDWCIYVASGHPPNLLGYVECVGDFISFIPPNTKIIFVGSICDLLKDYFAKSSYKMIDSGKFILMGKVAKEKLNALVAGSNTVIIPITKGEGSNLKTAEALYARKKIVGTTVSFRGYERYMNLPGVYIANTKNEFRNAILQSYLDPKLIVTNEHSKIVEETTWNNATNDLVNYFKNS